MLRRNLRVMSIRRSTILKARRVSENFKREESCWWTVRESVTAVVRLVVAFIRRLIIWETILVRRFVEDWADEKWVTRITWSSWLRFSRLRSRGRFSKLRVGWRALRIPKIVSWKVGKVWSLKSTSEFCSIISQRLLPSSLKLSLQKLR